MSRRKTGGAWRQALAKSVLRLREERGLSQRKFSESLGMHCAALGRVERGRGCDLDTLETIKERTGLSYSELLEPSECEHEWKPISDTLMECVKEGCGLVGRLEPEEEPELEVERVD